MYIFIEYLERILYKYHLIFIFTNAFRYKLLIKRQNRILEHHPEKKALHASGGVKTGVLDIMDPQVVECRTKQQL